MPSNTIHSKVDRTPPQVERVDASHCHVQTDLYKYTAIDGEFYGKRSVIIRINPAMESRVWSYFYAIGTKDCT